MNCKCGHGISRHDMGGCQHTVRKTDDFDLVCKCGLTPDAIADALREAGEKMAKQLRSLRQLASEYEQRGEYAASNIIFTPEYASALAEWEAANKSA